MAWSYRIARIAGVDIKIHSTFLLIVALGAIQWGLGNGVVGAFFGAALILLLFGCVTLHELGHSVVANYFGVPVREIILLPLGGVALLERNPKKPIHELLIAAAGPLVNVVIAFGLLLVTDLSALATLNEQGLTHRGTMTISLTSLLLWLLEANITLVVFNLIPAFPLDGGRMLRAILAMVFGMPRATRISSFVGQSIAVLLGILGVLSANIILVLVAVFIFFGAGQERVEGNVTTVLHTRCVGDAYNKYVLTLAVGDRIQKVIDYILTSYQPDFAVVQGQRLLGVVSREDVLNALKNPTPDVYVPDVYVTMIMQRDIVRVDASASLDDVRLVMSDKGVRVVAVYTDETYLGLVSIEDIAEAFTVLSFSERYHTSRSQQMQPDQPPV